MNINILEIDKTALKEILVAKHIPDLEAGTENGISDSNIPLSQLEED